MLLWEGRRGEGEGVGEGREEEGGGGAIMGCESLGQQFPSEYRIYVLCTQLLYTLFNIAKSTSVQLYIVKINLLEFYHIIVNLVLGQS